MQPITLCIIVAATVLTRSAYTNGRCEVKPADVGILLKKSGESVSIYCSATSDVTVGFLKGVSPIRSGGNIAIEGLPASSEKVLRISNVSHQNEGEYICVAGGTTCDIRVKVYDEIRFPNEDNEKIQYIRQGRSGVINCTSDGDPRPENEWFVEGKKILSGDRVFSVIDGNLGILVGASLNESVFTCRASLPDFSYFKDFNITLGVLKSEPLSCLQCRTFDVGHVGDNDSCSLGSEVSQRQECSSSCVTINATGPLSDGRIKYAMVRGCGDKISVLKESCMTLPNDKLSLDALTMFGSETGYTSAGICFCSSGDGCNDEPKTFSSPVIASSPVVARPSGNGGLGTRASFAVVIIALSGFLFLN